MKVYLAGIVIALVLAPTTQAHLPFKGNKQANLKHTRYVCNHGKNATKRWHCKATVWLERELVQKWALIQIRFATYIAKDAEIDPWPNCPDPYFQPGSTWHDTVNCENGGNWLDSPGYFRCGLQFEPRWEEYYNVRFCP